MTIRRPSIAIFIESTLYPIRDGYSFVMYHLLHLLSRQYQVIMIHNDRGWSDLTEFQKNTDIKIYYLKPEDFYNNTSAITRILKNHNIDITVISDDFMLAKHGYAIRKYTNSRILYYTIMVSSTVLRGLSATPIEIKDNKSREKNIIDIADAIFCFTKEDKQRIIDLGAPEGLIHVNKPFIPLGDKLRLDKNREILFIGNMYYGPNEQAVSVILDVSTKLLSQNTLINLIGDAPKDIVSRLENRKNIIFHNYQKNILPILKKCSLALAPISTGSGMRIKILELASHGIPTIGFSAAFEGVPRSANIGIVVNNANEMFTQTTKLCSDYDLLQRLGANAYNFIKSSCSGEDICQAIEEVYKMNRRNNQLTKKSMDLPSQPVWIQELIDKGKYERT